MKKYLGLALSSALMVSAAQSVQAARIPGKITLTPTVSTSGSVTTPTTTTTPASPNIVSTPTTPSVSGGITFGGSLSMNTSSASTASQVVSWVSPSVTTASGSFAGLGSSAVTLNSPWNFVSGAISPFWQVGGFTFDLISSKIASQGGSGRTGFVNVTGTGSVSASGFQTTTFTFNFNVQNGRVVGQPERFTFTITPTLVAQAGPQASVPDGGATILLLGLTLSGAALARKKMA